MDGLRADLKHPGGIGIVSTLRAGEDARLGRDGWRGSDAGALLLVVLVAGIARAVHLGATSLWWDEIVQVQTAALPSFAEVLARVRAGDPPGLGNAGAVPVDYLVLHGYLAVVPRPSPEYLEVYYRLPSWLFSTAAVAAVFRYARRFFGRAEAIASSLLLATAVPHALYAAEARFYSLFSLVTVLCLWAFSRVALSPRRPSAWVLHAAAGVLTFLTGLLGLLLLLGQYAVLASLLAGEALARPEADRRESGGSSRSAARRLLLPLGALLVSVAVIGGAIAAYYRETWVLVRLHRLSEVSRWDAAREVVSFFALESPLLLVLFLVSLAAVPIAAARSDRGRLAIAVHLVTSFLWIPILAELAGWKGYYVRPRHALFLLPYFALVAGIGLAELLRRIERSSAWARRARIVAPAIVVIVMALQLRPLAGFLFDPLRYASAVRPVRDVRALMTHLAGRVGSLSPEQAYLLIGERRRPAYLANPEVAWYLRQYRLEDRVILRTLGTSEEALARLESLCSADCSDRTAPALSMELGLGGSIELRTSLSELLGIDQPVLPPRVPIAAAGVLRYRLDPRSPPSQLERRVLARRGWTLFETLLAPRRDVVVVPRLAG
jgi:hypothetical protein